MASNRKIPYNKRFNSNKIKASQVVTSKTFRFVLTQNFKAKSNINWSKSTQEIDKQLYAKYKLTKEEIEFIESMIKPMAD
jgi:hypothetical protein